MAPDTEGLHPIANTKNAARVADIVFVHGLGGGSHSTWRHRSVEEKEHFFWPEALGKETPEWGIWSLGYAAGFSHWFGAQGMAIQDRARNLVLKLLNAGVGLRPLIFITHSMGGLEVKEIIVRSQTRGSAEWKQLVSSVGGVVFCGTPHRGAHLATAAKILANFFRTQEHLEQMKMGAPLLDTLHDEFIAWQNTSHVPLESYVETVGLFRTKSFLRSLPLGLAVPNESGNPGIAGCECHPISADHVTLVKPTSSGHDVYAGVLRFIHRALKSAAEATTPMSSLAHTATYATTSPMAPASILKIAVDISRIVKYAPAELIGREAETKLLTEAWTQAQRAQKGRPHTIMFVALGGEGKTSLVAKWAADLSAQGWTGCDAVFAWSFYRQGTGEQSATSADLFLKEALEFFGDVETASSAKDPVVKGKRLAELTGERRALLILDGVEPLQYAPTSPMPGELKDQGLAALLKGLAAASRGLCVVTTRYPLPDLKAFLGKTVREEKLARLSRAAGVHLLKTFEVRGSERRNLLLKEGNVTSEMVNEFEKLVEDVKGHALTLNLLGTYLRDAHGGDIGKRALVKLEEANAEEQGGHAFRVLDAYAKSFESEGEKGLRALALLRLLGLFDRPATAACLSSLLKAPAIPNLAEPLANLSETQLNLTLSRLKWANLLTVNGDASPCSYSSLSIPHSLDAHPLLREYFARRMREDQPEAWRAAHRRLYEHLCASTDEGNAPTLETLQPLYQAVAHGCQAGLANEAYVVYDKRLQRGKAHYPHKKLGAVSTDLGCIAAFFSTPWTDTISSISPEVAERVFDSASESLHSVGRLREARQAMEGLHRLCLRRHHAREIANSEILLSEIATSLGELNLAADYAQTAIGRSRQKFQLKMSHVAFGVALHYQGLAAAAHDEFHTAEAFESKQFKGRPCLCSIPGVCILRPSD